MTNGNQIAKRIGQSLKIDYPLVILLVLFLGIEIYFANGLFIWLDEAFTLNTTNIPLWETVKAAVIFEGQPPLYFVLLNLWRTIGSSIVVARIFSICSILLAAVFTYLIGKKQLKLQFPFLVVLLLILHPMIIWSGLEIRVYSTIVFFSALLTYTFREAYKEDSGDNVKAYRVIYSISALLAVCTQYYLSLMLLANFFFLLSAQKWKLSLNYLVAMILPSIAVLIFIPFLNGQLGGHTATKGDVHFFSDGIIYMILRAKEFLFPMPRLLSISNWWLYLLLLIIYLLSLKNTQLKVAQKVLTHKNYYFINVIFLIILFSLLLVFVGKYNVDRRHTILMIIPILLLFMQVIDFIPKKYIQFLFVAMVCGVYIFCIPLKMENDKRKPELIEIDKYIGNDQNVNLPVLVYRGEISLIFEFANEGRNPVFAIPAPINMMIPYDHCDWFVQDEKQIESFFATIPNYKSMWFISSEQDETDLGILPRVNCDINYGILLHYIESNFVIEEEHIFADKLILRRLKMK